MTPDPKTKLASEIIPPITENLHIYPPVKDPIAIAQISKKNHVPNRKYIHRLIHPIHLYQLIPECQWSPYKNPRCWLVHPPVSPSRTTPSCTGNSGNKDGKCFLVGSFFWARVSHISWGKSLRNVPKMEVNILLGIIAGCFWRRRDFPYISQYSIYSF